MAKCNDSNNNVDVATTTTMKSTMMTTTTMAAVWRAMEYDHDGNDDGGGRRQQQGRWRRRDGWQWWQRCNRWQQRWTTTMVTAMANDWTVHWKGGVRGREGMSTRGNKREERGGAQINEGLFWWGFKWSVIILVILDKWMVGFGWGYWIVLDHVWFLYRINPIKLG